MNDQHPADDLLIACALDELEDLGASERAELDAHIAGCAPCGELVRTLAGAMRRFREGERPEAPARILVDLIAAQAAVREGKRLPLRASGPEPERATDRDGREATRRERAGGHRLRRLRLSLVPTLAVAAFLLVLFLTGFWAGRRSAPGAVAPVPAVAPAGSAGPSSAGTRVAHVSRPLPEPPRIPFQPVQSEIR